MSATTSSDSSHEYSAFRLAIAVLAERLTALPPDDKDDLLELTKILFSADSEEERQSAMKAMDEIVEQRPLKLVSPVESEATSEGLRKWIDFISNGIREARIAAGLTQAELAGRSGLTQSHISRLENGEHSPSHATVKKIADALGIPVSSLDPSV